MRRSTLIPGLVPALALALAGAGCTNLDAEYQNGLPTAKQVTIKLPGQQGAASGASSGNLGSTSSPLLGQTSEFYAFTAGATAVVNGSAVALLALVDAIAAHPSTSHTASSRTWGPYTPGGLDPLTYRMVITKQSGDTYAFSIDGRPKASTSDGDFLALLDGIATKPEKGDTAKGMMTLHFDNRRTLIPSACEMGTISYVFDDTDSPATLDVEFAKFGNQNDGNSLCGHDDAHDATYHYTGNGDGSGDFVFSVATNLDDDSANKPALEQLSIHSRWESTGPGRSDVRAEGGDIPAELAAAGLTATFVSVSECWDGSFNSVYETSDPQQLGLRKTAGDPNACVYTSAMLP